MVEWDRGLWMGEGGFEVRLMKMRPEECTPKNDVLVAWRRGERRGEGVWEVDAESNAFVEGVKQGSVIKGLGVNEVAQVEVVLNQEVCGEGSAGEYVFPGGMGKRGRKVVHAVAESMGLAHVSRGKGKERQVMVRRTRWWPLFFDYYVGVGGPMMEEVCAEFEGKVPQQCLERRVLLRGRPRHVTVIGPAEIGKLAFKFKKEKAVLLDMATEALRGSAFRAVGLGCVMQPRKKGRGGCGRMQGAADDVRKDPGAEAGESALVNRTYFIVLEWPAAAALRERLGLGPADFHITMGFDVKDVHGPGKNRKTLIFEKEMQVSPWGT